eukprot:TRINITY_DN1322_c1_g1_i2.p3 TRINITY_DN1322_c1_g1~~TRINITY_DN1322_c1_g1_i2.p3  ORF type:complete len:200 (+),score=42.28 TRINITY_DN1322_c1_g1_i2:94-693(+)
MPLSAPSRASRRSAASHSTQTSEKSSISPQAYVRSAVSASDYTELCSRFIAQFRSARALIPSLDIDRFFADYKIECPAARRRLVEIGVPATVEHGRADASAGPSPKQVAEVVQHFITTMDSLRLNMAAVDQLSPLMKDLMESLSKIPLPVAYTGKAKVGEWVGLMHRMRASDELSPDQIRQLLFDLESAYTEFHRFLAQ